MPLFQKIFDPSVPIRKEETDTFNTLYNHSLQNTGEDFMIADYPMDLEHNLAWILVNQMSTKKACRSTTVTEPKKHWLLNSCSYMMWEHSFMCTRRNLLRTKQVAVWELCPLRRIKVMKHWKEEHSPMVDIFFYDKYETASPTVQTDSFMATTVIEVKECRFIAT